MRPFRATRPAPGPRGFSLVELTVVLGIAAILAAVAIVKTTAGSERVRLKAAAKKLEADIHYAQEQAMNLGREVQVRLDLQNNRYSLTWADGTPLKTPAGARDYVVQFGQGDYRSVQLTGSAVPGLVLRFRPDGRPYHLSGPLTDRLLLARLGTRYAVMIDPGTGNLELLEVGD
ncbi:MAG: GspH/FimT family protein [candidate division KSB1 bacterium]|nr:GspH/FimT family protein [candidate division KSB1 bacterium]